MLKVSGIVHERTQGVESLLSRTAAQLVDQTPSETGAAVTGRDDQRPHLGDGRAKRGELRTTDHLAARDRNHEPLRVLGDIVKRTRQQAALGRMPGDQPVHAPRITGCRRPNDWVDRQSNQASSAKLENCHGSSGAIAGVPHFANSRERLASGVQSVCTDGHGPRYGAATSRISRYGS
jgi:hypothetical protein